MWLHRLGPVWEKTSYPKVHIWGSNYSIIYRTTEQWSVILLIPGPELVFLLSKWRTWLTSKFSTKIPTQSCWIEPSDPFSTGSSHSLVSTGLTLFYSVELLLLRS